MTDPGTKRDKEMLDQLRYGRLVDDTGLDAAARRQLTEDPDLNQELLLNKALRLGQTDAPPMPGAMVDDAIVRAGEIQTGNSPLPPRAFNWRLAGALTLGVLVVAIVGLLLMPVKLNQTLGGVELAVESAWATGNGYILDYTIEFDEPYAGTSEDSPDHPLWRVERILAEWSAGRHGADGPPDGSPAAAMEIASGHYRPIGNAMYQYSFYIAVFSAGEDEIDALIATLAAVTELSEPEVDTEHWYFNKDVPDTYFTGRTVQINGKSYEYPQEIDLDSLEMLEMLLHISGEQGQLFFALDDIEEYRRYGLGDIIKIWWPDDQTVVMETYPAELDFESLGLPSWYHEFYVYIPGQEVDVDFDPVKLIQTYAGSVRKALQGGDSGIGGLPGMGDQFIVSLLPDAQWLGIEPDEFAASMSPGQVTDLERQAAELDAILEEIKTDHPDAVVPIHYPEGYGDDLPKTMHRFSAQLVSYGGVPTHWIAKIGVDRTERILTRLTAGIRDLGLTDYELLPVLPQQTRTLRHEWDQGERKMVPKAVAIWMFLPQSRWLAVPHDNPRATGLEKPTPEEYDRAEKEWEAGLLEEFTTEEIVVAKAQAAVVEQVYRDWMDANPQLKVRFQGEPIPKERAGKTTLSVNSAGDVTLSVYVHVLDLDEVTALAWIDELIALVEATGEVTTEASTRMELTKYYPPKE